MFLNVFRFSCPRASATIARRKFSFKFTLFALFFTLCLTPRILLVHMVQMWSPHPVVCTGCWLREPYAESA